MSTYNNAPVISSAPTTNSGNQIAGSSNGSVTNSKSSLGKDDFLKLMLAQMSNMDPLSQDNSDPSKSTEQMTQYSILEQLTNLNSGLSSLATQGSTAQSVALIGHNVTFSSDNGTPTTGKVESVQTVGGKNSLTIDGQAGIDPTRVIEVK
jgi:flagellar basal-body rod modification protein FlgD